MTSGSGANDREMPPTVGPDPGGEGGAGTSQGMVGTVLAGRYRILRLLGEGAMGSVYLGEHLMIGRQDAIKVLRDQLATDQEAIARFVRGTRNVSMIRHPNICTIYDYSDTGSGTQFVAMELVEGETLRDLVLREGRLPLERAVRIARQVAEALDAAHDAGIIHRDLKPANIMISQGRRGDDEIKVVDFDIAKGPRDGEGGGEEVTRLGFVVGTPEYMSPEQLIGDRLDGRSDLYSLALVLFRMLTGVLPFQGEGTQELIIKRLTEAPMRLGDAVPGEVFPAALDDAIARALSRRPEDRQSGAEEFGHEIVAAIGGVGDGGRVRVAAPGQGSEGVRGTVPSTKGIAATAVHGSASAGGGAKGSPPERATGRGKILVGAGAGAAVIAAVSLAIVLAGRGGGPEATEPLPLARPLVQESAETRPSLPSDGAGGAELAAAGVGSAPGGTGVASAGSATPISTAPAPAPAAPVASSGSGTIAATPPSSPPPAPLPAPPADQVLIRLLERLGPPAPGRPALLAIRDSARVLATNESLPSAQRATAAFTLASALLPLGDTLSAVDWLEVAVELQPAHRGANTLLRLLR